MSSASIQLWNCPCYGPTGATTSRRRGLLIGRLDQTSASTAFSRPMSIRTLGPMVGDSAIFLM